MAGRKPRKGEKIETNHIQSGDLLQCQWIQDRTWRGEMDELSVVKNTGKHFQDFCMDGCPYYEGNYQGEGVECKFYDGTNVPVVINPDPWVLRNMTLRIAAEKEGIVTGNRQGKLDKLKGKRRKK